MFVLPDYRSFSVGGDRVGDRLCPRYHGSCVFEWQSPFLGVVNETILTFGLASCAVTSGGNVRRNTCLLKLMLNCADKHV